MSSPHSGEDGASPEPSAMDDPRLFAAVQEYLAAIEQGKHVSRREFAARYPEIINELSDCLDALAFVNGAAEEMSGASPDAQRRPPRRSGRSDLDPSTSEPLGDFKLLREIGHGGMGAVYEATQLSLGRRVAVKVLPMAAALDERHLERFKNEAQAAARLHHTNIVPVYAVGYERSVHFYAMQLIEGHSLAQIIAELQTLADRGAGPKRLDHSDAGLDEKLDGELSAEKTLTSLGAAHTLEYCRSAVKLALQVAEALAYAHEAGVVHRDIKPANLLLDSRGKLWVTDFGLAQLNVDTGLTRSGDLVGTLRYMSPEQASGRAVVLDQRTDIYSLGITLYELLTLQKALPGPTHHALLHQIANEQPRSMRAIDKTIPRELETIINKAISKDASDRYANANAFADDLRRFLKDEPIHARPPSILDKGVKWVRRHKSLTAAMFALLALATLGFSISTFLIATAQSRTQGAYALEKQKAIEAEEEKVRAERIGRHAREAVEFLSNIASQEMDKPGFSDIRREMLEESLSYYQSFLEDGGDSPELASARARVTNFLQRYTALDTLLRTSARVRLLGDSLVRQELNARPADVTGLLTQASQSIPTQSVSADAATEAKRFTEQAEQLQKSTVATLGTQRTNRLTQIFLQTLGPGAMSDPTVVEQLQLSTAQQAAIRSILTKLRAARLAPPDGRVRMNFDMDGPDDGGGRPRGDNRPPHRHGPDDQDPDGAPGDPSRGPFAQMRLLRSQAMRQIIALLTPQQRTLWSGLLGNEFNIDAIHFAPPDGPGPDNMQRDMPGNGPPGGRRDDGPRF